MTKSRFFIIFMIFFNFSQSLMYINLSILKGIGYGTGLLYLLREWPHHRKNNIPKLEKVYLEYGTNYNFYVLHLHGWGAHAASFTGQPPEDSYIVSPAFSETIDKKIFYTSFGQESDVLTTLNSLKNTHFLTESINTVAHCRGATVFFNTICVLSTPSHPLLHEVQISEEERIMILNKFKSGKTIIISPLISVKQFLHDKMLGFLGNIIHDYFLAWFTKYQYKPNGMSPLSSLDSWHITDIPIQVIFPEFDDSIGFNLRTSFIKKLQEKNGKLFTKILVLRGEKKHWPPFLKVMRYKALFELFFSSQRAPLIKSAPIQ